MKRVLLLLCVLVILTLPFSACGGTPELTVAQLMADAGKYNGDVVVVSGFYFGGFEVMVLCEDLKYSGYAENHMVPEGKYLWVEGGIPSEVHDALYIQSEMGPRERFGKIEVKGKFATGGGYGHLGAYDSQISPTEVELLPWSPPER